MYMYMYRRATRVYTYLHTHNVNLDILCTGELHACGGFDGAWASDAFEAYEPRANAWRKLPPLPTPRANLAVVLVV